jgi:hypothetical protein
LVTPFGRILNYLLLREICGSAHPRSLLEFKKKINSYENKSFGAGEKFSQSVHIGDVEDWAGKVEGRLMGKKYEANFECKMLSLDHLFDLVMKNSQDYFSID